MKKILLILTLAVASSVSLKAQTAFSGTATNPTGAWTDTGSDTLTYRLAQSYKTVSIQPVITKVNGTIAGTATLYYCVDGVNYVSSGSSLSLTNATTNSTLWNLTTAARYFKIIVTGGTTLTATMSAKLSVTP